jgi:ectoine hydroxylase-related dioxygenase (phytanoyl-CoA dioxygenase family)
MDTQSLTSKRRQSVWLDGSAGDFEDFRAKVEIETRLLDWPFADEIAGNVPVYDGARVRREAGASMDLLSEWNTVFDTGPGIIVIRGGMADLSVVDRASDIFAGIIEAERDEGSGGGDHFAKPGANDRVWNGAEKHCLADARNFAEYYATDAVALAARAWLGRGYQLTAQVNRVNPGGAAQTAHRDYHLGFMNADQLATYPVQAHGFSPKLTLQGAIAHCDMPLASGPTMLLPYSQRFLEGYVAYNRPEYQAYFAAHHVQLPLEKGDLLFFNPAVMHGAGTNTSTDILRLANLLQIGSAFGRSIESVNRSAMTKALYPVLTTGDFEARAVANVIAASAEGYAFPTNLDLDPPVGGLIPLSQAELMAAYLDEGRSVVDWEAEVEAMERRRAP